MSNAHCDMISFELLYMTIIHEMEFLSSCDCGSAREEGKWTQTEQWGCRLCFSSRQSSPIAHSFVHRVAFSICFSSTFSWGFLRKTQVGLVRL
ncbi:hypothetical protein L6164_025699 [Bauhinia variegata]|uniref:Uncharacterized protein n=1 Tax=Bauhinia variegata TaxID=167791 RepID=A0ACB9M1P3_BAUVA|nr:hypothetical protein L6164_025699 [Bauhinia variegata]